MADEDRLTALENAVHSLGSTLVTGEHDNHTGFLGWLRARLAAKQAVPQPEAPPVIQPPQAPPPQ